MDPMDSRVSVSLANLTVDFVSLTGVARARQLLARLIDWTAVHSPHGTLPLDFSGIEAASASFLRESVLAFRDYARAYQPEVFPVVANIDETVRDEFNVLLKQRREAMLACTVDEKGVITAPEILGSLETGLKATLDAVRRRGPVTPAQLLDGDLKASTLSNRLVALVRQGFLAVTDDNRRVYRFVLDAGGGNGD
jgi:hypothetical protein